MLKLKRVEIQGFKSFYDRTEMKFNGSGIAAVVGPNGCGKSNLSDAISWVLGEQSAKSLRGARMEDVIFAGTRDRKALGMASVNMTLVPDDLAIKPMDPAVSIPVPESSEEPERAEPLPTHAAQTAEKQGEITITRRLYRSGESEYLVNGKQARLRDIQDLFLGTGLGPESYAIIEQGRIGQILSNRPQDRRNVIEEAAGVTRFKTRKRLAEAKLEGAKQNLSRVFDILEEVTRQANSLKRQAAKSKRYGELKGEATGYLQKTLAARFQLLERNMAQVAIELSVATKEVEAAGEAIGQREAEQGRLLEAAYATGQTLRDERKQLGELRLELERARSRVEHQTRQIEQIEARFGTGEREAAALEGQAEERARELGSQTADLAGLEEVFARARADLEAKGAERTAAQSRLSEQERGLEAARQQVMRLLGESSGLRNRIAQMEAQIASAARERTRAEGEEQQSVNDGKRIQSARAQLSERMSARQTDLVSVADQRKEVESELGAKRAELGRRRQDADRLRSEYSRVKARRDSLEEVIQHRSYTTETVKKLFTAVEKNRVPGLKPSGVLADFLEVDAGLEKAAEEFLHDELEYVVVSDWAQAERGMELMRGEMEGRATFLVEKSGNQPERKHVPLPPDESAGLRKLTGALRLSNGLTQMPSEMISRIANCYLASNRDIAREFAEQYPHCWFLTDDGVSYHGQAVSGGKKSGAGPLALKRELREMQKLEGVKQAEFDALSARLLELERAIAKLSEQGEQLRVRQQAQEKEVLALDLESRKLAEENQRVQTRLSNARLELDRLARDGQKITEALRRDQALLAEGEKRRGNLEAELEAAREQLGDLRAALARAGEEHGALRAQVAGAEERQRAAVAHRARLEAQVNELRNRRSNLLRETEQLMAEKARLVASNGELVVRIERLTESDGQREKLVAELSESEGNLRERLAGLEDELKRLRTAAGVAGERRSEKQVALARDESDLRHLEETCQKELGCALASLESVDETALVAEKLSELDTRYTEVRRKIEALGPVNAQALEEFEEAQQRQDFLTAQRADLLQSIRDTEQAIGEIDGESRKRFSQAFAAINANFREMFQTLFGGGTGEMRLTDEDNLGESGIDIVASPPGKRLQSVLLLSGGEKSLTAMALLMSIFQYSPSPFCILDEVDAPLDEANVDRLTKLLGQMAAQTQFIVITHAKRTMEAAQSLYGVTMQEPGVSKLVSVKFKEQDGKTGEDVKPRSIKAVVEGEPLLDAVGA